MRHGGAGGFAVVLALVAAGCASDGPVEYSRSTEPDAHDAQRAGIGDVWHAIAVVHPTQGNRVSGTVRFTQEAGYGGTSLRIVAELDGLTPNAFHAFHVHEFGDCSSADGTSAGGHYNPEGHPHAGPDAPMRHAGDLGNLRADATGHAHYEITVRNATISMGQNPLLGRAVIVHAGVDDFTTQPTGNAGGRIGCGVIGVAKAPQ